MTFMKKNAIVDLLLHFQKGLCASHIKLGLCTFNLSEFLKNTGILKMETIYIFLIFFKEWR